VKATHSANLSTNRLVERFADIAVAQGEALFYDEYATFNRIFQQMNGVDDELRARSVTARLALLRL
jgi:hypothetical protein